ncbi:MAG: MFS transporter [Candidatus Rokubacteria bacterium]|nr:MFS transporter [Candidatus Rokubacteria bacterium]
MKNRPRAVLATACGAHFVHDSFSDILYIFLPLWASEFGLGFAQVGVIRTAYTGGMASFQIPAGLLAERWGERRLLAAGTAVTACGFVAAGMWAGGFVSLLALLLLAGLGSGVQHPLSSSIVSKAYETGARRAALGTYNFSGDLGKIAASAIVAFAAALIGWRATSAAAGIVGILAAGAILAILARLVVGGRAVPEHAPAADGAGNGWGIRDPRGFQALAAIGMIDNATRTGLLTFLPFALIAKGSTVAGIGTALALVFAGGALGKFVCGLVAEKVGVLAAPLPVALAILLPLGIALNGTSSVLYATVADLVTTDRRSRAYGLYYTLAIGASSLAPSVYGLVGDVAGVTATLVIVALVVLVTIPLCLLLRAAVAEPARA